MVTTGIQLLRSSSLFSGAPYAYAAQAPPGSRLVFLAGACPLDSQGNTVGTGNGDHDVPSTLVGVTVLGYRDQLVEIEAVAALSDAVV